MIFPLPKNDPEKSPGRHRLAGRTLRLAAAVAAVELVVYWLLVIRFPAVMAALSVLIAGMAVYFRKKAADGGEFREELGLSDRDLALVKKYCTGWIFISLYGLAFALFLVYH